MPTPSAHDLRTTSKAIEFLARRWQEPPSLEEVAAHVGRSPHHFQRVFRRLTGISPKRFSQSLLADRAEQLVRRSAPVLASSLDAGLSSPSRLHDLMVGLRGMTPGEIKNSGEGLAIQYGVHPTPLGSCFVAQTARGVCELAFLDEGERIDGAVDALRQRWPRADVQHAPSSTAEVASMLLTAHGRGSPISLHVRGTNFQLRVWKALLSIPPGEVTAYGDLAKAIGAPRAARAVGSAVGQNPVAVLIPCHRVLLANGALGQYRWDPFRKRSLLALEGEAHGV